MRASLLSTATLGLVLAAGLIPGAEAGQQDGRFQLSQAGSPDSVPTPRAGGSDGGVNLGRPATPASAGVPVGRPQQAQPTGGGSGSEASGPPPGPAASPGVPQVSPRTVEQNPDTPSGG